MISKPRILIRQWASQGKEGASLSVYSRYLTQGGFQNMTGFQHTFVELNVVYMRGVSRNILMHSAFSPVIFTIFISVLIKRDMLIHFSKDTSWEREIM